ncbi:MAG: delta-60 repeat domain-containing protein [Opitutaceae bacterium]|nr:delta-60 repeat domain-containing protein [Opitutaceae bacterium]
MASARHSFIRSIATLAILVTAVVTGSRAQSTGYGDGFDPNSNANIYAMVRQPDGKVIVGGNFTLFEPDHFGTTVLRERIARLNRDGTVDSTFSSYTNGDISAIALQPDGKILIAGKFSIVGNASGWLERTGVARLNADGSVDANFVQVNPADPTNSYYPQAIIRAVALQSDGRIIIGGAFRTLQPTGAASPITRTRLARLNSDGTVDETFDVAVNNPVLALLVEPDDRIILGGGFTTVRPTGSTTAVARQRIARLNTDGTLDGGFAAALNNRVLALARQADGAVMVGGEFTSVTPPSAASSTELGFLARFDRDGDYDSTFPGRTNAAVESLAIQSDGRILAGGRFTWARASGGASIIVRNYFARFFVDGSVDTSFVVSTSAPVTASIVQPDGSILLGGYFTTVGSTSGYSGKRGRVARILSDGTLDIAFGSSRSGVVTSVVEEAGGSLLVGGSYSAIGSVTRTNLARVSRDGTILPGFAPEINGAVYTVNVLPSGKILIGGAFTRVDGALSRYIARLNPDGTRDATFDPNPNAPVYTIALQGDGRILIGGAFTSVRSDEDEDDDDDVDDFDTVARRYIARLSENGAVDDAFDPSPNLTVNSIVVQPDGKILVGGDFYTLQPNGAKNASSYYYVVRLNTDGTPDDSFLPRPNASVSQVLLEPDGRIVLCGSFTSLLPGKATDAITRRYLARVGADGELDATFNPGPDQAVYSVARYSDGRYLVRGAFQSFQPNTDATWTSRPYLAWLTSAGVPDAARVLTPDAAASVARVLADGSALIGSSFSRLTGSSQDDVSLVTDLLVQVDASATVDSGFVLNGGEAGASSYVAALAQQVGGRIYAAGSFSSSWGTLNSGITRFYPDGATDYTFSSQADAPVLAVAALETSDDEEEEGGPVAWLESTGDYRASFGRVGAAQLDGSVYAIAVQSDGKVIVGGDFVTSSVNVGDDLARLNADGTFDTSFNPSPDASIQAVALLPDGRMIIGGTFTKLGSTSHAYLARLNADGTLDASWAPTPNGAIQQVAVMADGSVYVAGVFTTFKPNGSSTTVTRSYAARIKADGTVDTEFDPEPNATVYQIVPLSDGKVILGGTFTTIKGKARRYLGRVDAKGALDTAYYPNPNGPVSRIVLADSTGGAIVAGEFSSFEQNDAGTSVSRSLVARVNSDGSLEETFQPIPNNFVEDIAVHSDGTIVLSGSFTAFRFEEGGTATRRNYLARFLPAGTLDPLFNPNSNGVVYTVNRRADGSMLIGGSFNQLRPSAVVVVGGEFQNFAESPTPYLARLNDDGSIDAYFTARPNGPVRALVEQSDGMLVVGGDFTEVAGAAQARLARLDPDGVVDPEFTPVIDGSVHTLAVQGDDRVLIGGDFTTVGGASRTRLARLLAGGGLDTSFNASVDVRVSAIATQADGRILIGGAFTQVNGTSRSYLARLATDGTLDASFAPVLDGAVYAIAAQADGAVLIGGAFTQVGGVARERVARLLPNGTLDTAFTPEADGDVRALLLMADGRVVAGGAFTQFGGRNMLMVSRVSNLTPTVYTGALNDSLSTFTWASSGSAPVFSSVSIASSDDGETWTNLGDAVLTSSGTWQLSGITAFGADRFNHVRARAVQASNSGGSIGRVEFTWAFYGSVASGPASLLNSGGALAGWTNGSGGTGSGSGSGGTGGSGGGSGGSGSGGTGSGGSGGGSGGGSTTTQTFHLVNLSMRAWPEDGQPFIAGLVVGGQAEGKVLLRAVGPGLARFGVDPVMSGPRMSLFDGSGSRLSTSQAWTGDETVAATAASVGAFTLDPTSADSAVVRTLAPGAYTIHVDSGDGLNGVALGEVYFAGETGGLANFSARSTAGAGTAATIAGFVVGGEQPRRVLLRGVGPALGRFGVTDAAPDPALHVYDSTGRLIASNDDWQTQLEGGTAVEVSSAAVAVRAFSLPLGSKDAAVVLELPPGSYTVHVGGAVAGTVLAEVYEIQ